MVSISVTAVVRSTVVGMLGSLMVTPANGCTGASDVVVCPATVPLMVGGVVLIDGAGWTWRVQAMEGVPLLPIANSIQYPGGTKAGSVTLRLPSACTAKER